MVNRFEVRRPHDQHLLELALHGSALIEPEDLGSALYLMRVRKETEAFNIDPIWGKPNTFRLSLNDMFLAVDEDRSTHKRAVFRLWPFSTL